MKKLFILVLLFFVSQPVMAQLDQTPFIVWSDGLLWLGDTDKTLTFWESCYTGDDTWQIELAPNGKNIAFTVDDEIVREAKENRRSMLGAGKIFPNNLWICGEGLGGLPLTRITAQPENASIADNMQADYGLSRVSFVWSPDGTKLAWIETFYPEYTERQIGIYDLATGENTIMPFSHDSVQEPYSIVWGNTGLLIEGWDSRGDVLLLYDLDGNLLNTFPFKITASTFLGYFLWVQADGREEILVHFNDAHWETLDPETGITSVFDGSLAQFSLSAENALTVQMQPKTDYYGYGVSRKIVNSDGEELHSLSRFRLFNRAAISWDGQQIIYVEDNGDDPDQLFYWENGEAEELHIPSPIHGTTILVWWSPQGWRLVKE